MNCDRLNKELFQNYQLRSVNLVLFCTLTHLHIKLAACFLNLLIYCNKK